MGLPKTTKTLQTPKQNTFQVSIPLTESEKHLMKLDFHKAATYLKLPNKADFLK